MAVVLCNVTSYCS